MNKIYILCFLNRTTKCSSILGVILSVFFLLLPCLAKADWKSDVIKSLKNGGAYVEDTEGKILFEHRSNDFFIPASTLKILTSYVALKTLGPKYRFKTDFFLRNSRELVVKAYGDPNLTSEEIRLLAQILKEKLASNINGQKDNKHVTIANIIVDLSFFEKNIDIDGSSRTSNPYDAKNDPLVANFNTIYYTKTAKEIRSAEPQTPLTNLAIIAAKNSPAGTQRINLSTLSQKIDNISSKYFAELLKTFIEDDKTSIDLKTKNKSTSEDIRKIKVNIIGKVLFDTVKDSDELILSWKSSKNLAETVRDILKHSTNFSANQLFLVLGAHRYGAPASVEKGQLFFQEFVIKELGWRNFKILEGAGLSPKNKVTPRQMAQLLKKFEPYKKLLDIKVDPFLAKTGTLTGVNTLAGYFPHPAGKEAKGRASRELKDRASQDSSHSTFGKMLRFVILVNSDVPSEYKFAVAESIQSGLELGR